MSLVWIVVALAFAVAEVATVALFAAFVAIGALAAAVAAFAGVGLVGQAAIFAVVTVAGVVAARPWLVGHLRRRHGPEMMSGAAGMIGQSALVVDPIEGPHARGHVRIAGEDWPALSADGSVVTAGTTVRIVEIRQATLVVHEET